ncbi:MAG: hypothetical protein K2X77_19415 [Candidatus Obscuribacterales bacterium]|nr:hypothetical protein [Candidatus Obscuribacterales bacterium]
MFKNLDRDAVIQQFGVTPIAFVPDEEIWNIVTPQTRAFLGKIVGSESGEKDNTDGLFPGDQVSNLNANVLAGSSKVLRFPYVYTQYITENGRFVVKRDGVKIKAMGWVGDLSKGAGELIYSFALRDRRFDGTARANDCSLLDYPYDNPSNRPLANLATPHSFSSVETSLYSWLPGTRVGGACGDADFENFVRNPFTFVDKPELFLSLFERALKTDRLPGMYAQPIPDVGRSTHRAFDKLSSLAGYDFLETAPSHLHVLLWNLKDGYRVSSPAQQLVTEQLRAGLKRMRESGVKLPRSADPWIVALQSLPRKYIPDAYFLGGAVWPQDNIGPINLWLYKPLSERAKEAVA